MSAAACVALLCCGARQAQEPPAAERPFRIDVVDSRTQRGVPLVELRTVHGLSYVTDSGGVAAVGAPELFGREVFFEVSSHGYRFPRDGFGFCGFCAKIEAGGRTQVEIERVNIAERLYRVTGAGLYADTLRCGGRAPIAAPIENAGVAGLDSVVTAPYRGRLYWFWGDTNRLAHPLGNFAVTGATSELPERGGLPPSAGVDLHYFSDGAGVVKKMCPIDGKPGPVWIDGLVTPRDADGRERLVAHYMRMKSLGEMYEQGLALYDDDAEVFRPVAQAPLDAALVARGQPFRWDGGGGAHWYFASPFALTRCRDQLEALLDHREYESFTCLAQGARFDAAAPALERDAGGRLAYAWRKDTAPVGPAEQEELIARGHAAANELWIQLGDAATGKPVRAHAGSTCYNAWRRRWILIAEELHGTSLAGEIWYAEAPAPLGPWRAAVKIVTHDDYTFYNPKQHPYFDEDGGRVIYFEGTYSRMFSGAQVPTPRYDYNQVMYRLDLSDSRLRPARSADAAGAPDGR